MSVKSIKSLNMLLSGIRMFETKTKSEMFISDTDLIQSYEDFDKAQKIVSFIRKGSFLPKNNRYDGARNLLERYEVGFSRFDMSELLGIHPNSVYRLMTNISSLLDNMFPKPLVDLLEDRDFNTIIKCVSSSEKSTYVKEIDDMLIAWSRVNLTPSLPMHGSIGGLPISLNQLSEQGLEKYKGSLDKVLGILIQISELTDEEATIFGIIKKSLSDNSYVPFELLDILEEKLKVVV